MRMNSGHMKKRGRRNRVLRSLLFCMLILIIPEFVSAGYSETGLRFRSHEADKEERTSLDITFKRNFKFRKYLSVEFDIRVVPDAEHYGHIAEIKIGEASRIELLLTNFPYPHLSYLMLYDKEIIDRKVPADEASFFGWTHFKIELVAHRDSLFSIMENGRKIADGIGLPDDRAVKIIFGADYGSRQVISDVAPFVIRNVAVSETPGKVDYFWPLNVYTEEQYTYDTLHDRPALLLNPNINNHDRWKKVASLEFDSRAFFVKGAGNTGYFITRNMVQQYDFAKNAMVARYAFSPDLPFKQLKNQFIYDAPRNRIILYDVERQDSLVWFDFENSKWSVPYDRRNNYTYLHHNRLFSPVDSSLLQLFGYGLHRYRSSLFRKDPTGKVSCTDLSSFIQPRYLSAVGIADSTLYIYGGVGNSKGKQEFGSEIFNDLYAVDISTFRIEKLWERETDGDSEVGVPSLLIDSAGQKALGLFFCPNRYSSSLQLKELDLQRGTFRSLADTIPFIFRDISSEADLLRSPDSNQLFAVVSCCVDDGRFKTDIYTIYTPILSEKKHAALRFWQIVAGFLGLCLLAVCGGILMRKRKRRNCGREVAESPQEKSEEESVFGTVHAVPRPKMPGIYLLGTFQVIDRSGNDITAEFSAMLKQLLVLIILYTGKNGKGVSNTLLKEYFWSDKSEQSTRNNRNVNMRKLRMLLETVGDFEITTDNSCWRIERISEEAVCDWSQAVRLLNSVEGNMDPDEPVLSDIVRVVSCGPLLPNTTYDWLDSFKNAYSDRAIRVLERLRERALQSGDIKSQLQLSDCILIFDSLDEDSMRIKCIALVALGRIGTAKKSFDRFIREYRQIMGEEYPDSFEKFIQTV